MKKVILFCGAILVMSAAVANAQLSLTFGDCGGATNTTWTCTGNTGLAFTAVCSAIAPAGLQHVTGEESTVEIAFPTAVPEWWKAGTGFCRAGTAVAVNYSGELFSCIDYFGGVSPTVGSNSYQIGPDAGVGDPNGPIDANRIRIRALSAVDYNLALLAPPPAPGDPVFLFSIAVSKSKTVGTGACAGCDSPTWMALKSVKLTQPAGVGDPVQGSRDVFGCGSMQGAPEAECAHATPTSRSSWGQLKSLYR